MTNTMKPVLAGALLAMVSVGIAGTASAAPVGVTSSLCKPES